MTGDLGYFLEFFAYLPHPIIPRPMARSSDNQYPCTRQSAVVDSCRAMRAEIALSSHNFWTGLASNAANCVPTMYVWSTSDLQLIYA